MRFIAEFFPEFAGKFEEIDELYRGNIQYCPK